MKIELVIPNWGRFGRCGRPAPAEREEVPPAEGAEQGSHTPEYRGCSSGLCRSSLGLKVLPRHDPEYPTHFPLNRIFGLGPR